MRLLTLMGATIKDIAQRLKISTSTVSYALNGGPRPVPEAVKSEVLRVARELKYRPNRVARSLVTRRTNTIGLLPTQALPNLAVSPYFQLCFNGILNEAEETKYDVLVFSQVQPEWGDTEELIDVLWDGRTDGTILVAPLVDSPVVRALSQIGAPFTVVNSSIPGAVCLTCDNRHGVELAMGHLLDLGHRHIAHLAGPATLDDAVARREAFTGICRDSGVHVRPEWILETDFTTSDGEAKAHDLLGQRHRPTAVFCGNDEAAQGLVLAARAHGVRVPEDLSVVGFDNIFQCQHMRPPLTTVEQPISEMGRVAFQQLIELIEGREAASREMETTLVVRESTAPPSPTAKLL